MGPSGTAVLSGWKEIANYLERGVRTVQRYERQSHLPVRRVQMTRCSSVFALAKDLDNWLDQTPLRSFDPNPVEDSGKSQALQNHQKAIVTLQSRLRVFSERLIEGQRILDRKRWFGVED